MTSYQNLDPQDAAICEALEAGKSDADIMTEFGVGEEKLAQLRPVVAEKTGGNENGTDDLKGAPLNENSPGAADGPGVMPGDTEQADNNSPETDEEAASNEAAA